MKLGFVFVKEEYPVTSPYIANPQSMMTLTYNCVFFVLQKPAGAAAAAAAAAAPTDGGAGGAGGASAATEAASA